jgi:hypothetical protein
VDPIDSTETKRTGIDYRIGGLHSRRIPFVPQQTASVGLTRPKGSFAGWAVASAVTCVTRLSELFR